MTSPGQTSVEWLYGAQCARFTVHVQFGKGGIHKISVDVTAERLQEAAERLRERPEAEAFAYDGGVRRGRGWQSVPIRVPREMLLGIADALRGAVDADDAAHRFWHWERPGVSRPCSSCRESLDAQEAAVDAARDQFVRAWADELSATRETIERMLCEFGNLPQRTPR